MKLKDYLKKELSGSEALYGFCAWLTTQKEKTVMSSSDDCASIVQKIDVFIKANKLSDPNEKYHEKLVHPVTDYDKNKDI
jgi:hypothetical protein